MDKRYDAFFSHSSQDKPTVGRIAEALEDLGLRVWVDEWELQPGLPWQELVEKALESSRATVVFIGPQGFGPWEIPEMRIALDDQVRRRNPVIPVLLPGIAQDSVTIPPFLRRNTWVMFKGVDDTDALDRLYWGITGDNPRRRRRRQGATIQTLKTTQTDPCDEALQNLSAFLKNGNVTFFVGKGVFCGEWALPLSSCEITRHLLGSLELIDVGYNQLLPSLDLAATYYAAKEGDASLENRIVDLIMDHPELVPSIYQTLVELLLTLRKRPVRRIRRGVPQLIITTNFDVILERTLLQSGIPFTRLVQYRSAPQIDINEYAEVSVMQDGSIRVVSPDGLSQTADRGDLDGMEDLIATFSQRTVGLGENVGGVNPLHALAIQDLTTPILYKFHGSQDVPNSCTISTDQYFDFVWRTLRDDCIPAQITAIIANSPNLFLGCRILDSDFRLSYHTLLRKPLEIRRDKRYAVHARHEGEELDCNYRMERKIWESIKNVALSQYGIEMLDAPGEDFLRRLREQVKAELEGAA